MTTKPFLLALDTSGPHCAVALLGPGGRVFSRDEPMEKGQAERLMPLAEAVLAEAGLGWRDLAALAVCTGPGNFTGIRISVAATRGLALGLGLPAIGVTRLEALAQGLPRPLTVLEDARRGEVYRQVFTDQGAGPAELVADPGAPAGAVTGSAAGPAALAPAMPLVEAVLQIAAARLKAPGPRPAPFYLRGADAAPPSDPPPVLLPDPALP